MDNQDNCQDNWVITAPARASLLLTGQQGLFPVHRIYCVGRNYSAHAREMGHSGREAPFFFSKPADAVTQSATVAYPPRTSELHHEVELVVALGRAGANISAGAALDYVFGYAVGVDMTRRDLQTEAKKHGRPWDLAKGFDQSAPLSLLCPVAQCGHPQTAAIELKVNGEMRQQGTLQDMIWPVADIIAELSTHVQLRAGDLVFTGTPEGVGPLSVGDTVDCRIDGLADHRFELVAAP